MILIVNICSEKLHYYEFVKPIEDILERKGFKHFTRHYRKIKEKDLKKADKVIICGTSLKDNEFLRNLGKFQWLKDYKKPIFGICGGAHVIGLVFGHTLKKKQEIGLKETNIKNFLGVNGKKQVYHLHQFYVLPEIYRKNKIYAVLFHPEVRNKEIVVNFCNNA